MVEPEARDSDINAVLKASDSIHEEDTKTRSRRAVHMPTKYDGFEMTVAKI